MDPAAKVTGGANAPAPEDAMDVEQQRGANWPHWPDRGNGPARSDRLERRLFRDSARDAEIAAASETIRMIQQATAVKEAEIERLEAAVASRNGTATQPAADEPAVAYLVFVWTPAGYALDTALGDVPEVGARVQVNGHEYAVAKLGRSPLPGDERRCAYLELL